MTSAGLLGGGVALDDVTAGATTADSGEEENQDLRNDICGELVDCKLRSWDTAQPY